MFEFSVARKYLIPRWRQLSVSIISLISVLVISLVVWLILVFFSVTNGLETIWTEKLIAITAPVRVTPTPEYYESYYFHIDSISDSSDYTFKSIGAKRNASLSDPYDPGFDQEIPSDWASPDLAPSGNLKDPVKELFSVIDQLGVTANDYELAVANIQLKLIRESFQEPTFLNNTAYLGSFDPENLSLEKTLLPIRPEDVQNLIDHSGDLERLFQAVQVTKVRTLPTGWRIPKNALPKEGTLLASKLGQIYFISESGDEKIDLKQLPELPIFIPGGVELTASAIPSGHYQIDAEIQGHRIQAEVPIWQMDVSEIKLLDEANPYWVTRQGDHFALPESERLGDPVILPKTYLNSDVRIGDQGHLTYQTGTASGMQEMRLPIWVAGFYDYGVIPAGAKYLMIDGSVTSMIRANYNHMDYNNTAGVNVRFEDLERAPQLKEDLEIALADRGIDRYWKVETYEEFEYTRDVIRQLRSERNLFSLISTVIIIVACSNIISMLIILVNDKKMEIGILRAMGASSRSIALIFGFCGFLMGFLGSIIGVGLAYITLKNIYVLIDFIGAIQGHDVLNTLYFGDTLPTTLSTEALTFVLISTAITSLLAGIVPAVKASCLRPAAILRSE